MIDLYAALAPESGLAREFAIIPPDPPDELLWRAPILLGTAADCDVERLSHTPLSSFVVGAYGFTRADTLMRGVGEAVERFSLHPRPDSGLQTIEGNFAQVSAKSPALPFYLPNLALGPCSGVEETLPWYLAKRLRDGSLEYVPAPLVDFPLQDTRGFDPTPSGAASGDTYERAILAALLEVIERDAVLVAWRRQLSVRLVDPGQISRVGPETAGWGQLKAMLSLCGQAGLRTALVSLPVSVSGIYCSMAVAIDERGDLPAGGVGARADMDAGACLAGSLREALQVCSSLRRLRAKVPSAAVGSVVTSDLDRAFYYSSEEGVSNLHRWLDRLVVGSDWEAPNCYAPPTIDTVVGDMVEDGADPLLVDLSGRIPASLRRHGWVAVKVIPVGYQTLVSNELCSFGWNQARLESAETRTGLTCIPESDHLTMPHPLI